MKFNQFLLAACLLLLSILSVGQGVDQWIPERPSPPKLVNDYIDLLTPAQEEALEHKLVAYDDSTSSQIAVVTIGNIGDYEIGDFAVALGRKWGVGGSKFNNGIVLVVLIDKERNKRKIWIATGYGLEGAIPDITAKQIIELEILPNFKAHDIYRGIDRGTDALIQAASGEYKAPEGYQKKGKKKKGGNLIVALLVFILIIFILSKINHRGGGGMMSRRGYRKWNDTPPIWWFPSGGGSSGWGGGSSGGGGFGGFGGGSFGGGGAGGDW